jgi:glutamate-1-semialdehyde 2,1-aminomutase
VTTSLTDTRSAELYRRAVRVLPGGVNSPVRAMRSIGRDPVFVDRAAGAELIDVDGNTYVDYVCSWGPLIHGHAFPPVLAAVAAPNVVPPCAAAVIASSTAGSAWPRISGPHEHIQST